MISENELNSYKSEFIEKYENLQQLTVSTSGLVKNAERTDDRKAYKYVSWIDYWRAMTGNHQTTLSCNSCWKEINVGEPTFAQKFDYISKGETAADHQAMGGHVWMTAPTEEDWKGGRYITPLCPACNNKRGQQINLRAGSELCKEEGSQKSYVCY